MDDHIIDTLLVSWNGPTELSSLAPRPMQLGFELREADIYAKRFATRR